MFSIFVAFLIVALKIIFWDAAPLTAVQSIAAPLFFWHVFSSIVLLMTCLGCAAFAVCEEKEAMYKKSCRLLAYVIIYSPGYILASLLLKRASEQDTIASTWPVIVILYTITILCQLTIKREQD